MTNEYNLAEQIIDYCMEKNILGKYNIVCGNKLVSFNIKIAPKICNECGREL